MTGFIALLVSENVKAYSTTDLAGAAAVLANRVETCPNSDTYPEALARVAAEMAERTGRIAAMRRHPSARAPRPGVVTTVRHLV